MGTLKCALCLRAPGRITAANLVSLSTTTDKSRKQTLLPEVKKHSKNRSVTSRSRNRMNGGLWITVYRHIGDGEANPESVKGHGHCDHINIEHSFKVVCTFNRLTQTLSPTRPCF